MTKLLSRSCRPLTYLLTFLLLPLVLIVSTGQTARAAVVAVGPTVAATATKSSPFPGEDVSCNLTGYTRLHDTGLYSVRATVNCSWSWGTDVEGGRLVARDGDTSTSNDCRFEAAYFTVTEQTSTETTLTANLHPETPPQADCVLTQGDLYLMYTPSGGTSADQATSAEMLGFAWSLGALPEAQTGPGDPVSCQNVGSLTRPYWSGVREVLGTPVNSTHRIVKVDAPFTLHTNVGSTGAGTLHWYFVLKGRTAASAGGNVNPYYGAPLWTEKPTQAWHEDLGGPLFVVHGRSSISDTSLYVPGTAGLTVDPNIALSTYGDRSLSPTPQKYDVVGAGYWFRKLSSDASPGEPLHVAGLQESVFRSMFGVTDPTDCRWYFGPRIVREDIAGTTEIPAGPMDGDGTTSTVDEPVELPADDPGTGEDGSCAGFSFTDPSSWASAGICVLVKAVRALFSVMRDVLGVLSGMVSGIVSGILNGLSALFVPSQDSLDGMKDALDFTEHPNLAGWTDTLTTDGLLGQGSSGPAMRETGEMNTLSTPSIVPGVVLTGSCQGPGIAAEKLAVLGYEGTLHPFAACDGTMATVAQWTRLLLMMFVGLSAALKVFQMLAVGVGAARSAHILGSFDWSEASRR